MPVSPELLLAELRNAVPDAVAVFTEGRCFQLHLVLRAVFPDAEAWYDKQHVITKIGDRFYDITGRVQPGRHRPMSEEPEHYREAFTWTTGR